MVKIGPAGPARQWYIQVDPGAVEFRRLTESNFDGVEVADRPVKPPSNFFRAAAAFNVQFFDAITKMTEFFSVQFIQYQKTR